jgi:hypothetical protein
MVKEIQTLLKKGKFSGDEVGQLMIQNLVATYKNYLKGKEDQGLLTLAEMNTIINGIKKSEDIKRYNEYRHLLEYIANAIKAYMIYEGSAEEYLWRIYFSLSEMQHAEAENARSFRQPRIMTQKQYDELKKTEFDKKMSWGFSVNHFILHALDYYLNLYQDGKQTPLDKHFTAAKKEPYVFQDGDNGTMFDLLENAEEYYSIDLVDHEGDIYDFMEDFPHLFKDLWKKLTTIKGLSFLKHIPKKKYLDDDLISFKDLYKNDIMDFKAWGDLFQPERCPGGVAVLQPSNFYPREQIDEQGYYKEPESNWRKNFMAEAILEGETKDNLTRWLALHRGSLRECFVIQTTLKLIGEFTGNPEVATLIDKENRLAERAELLMCVIKDAPNCIHTRYGILPNERPVEELREEFAKTFEPVDIKFLMPTEEAIEQARETINFTIIRDNPEQLYAILRNETAVNMGKGAY